MAAVIVPSEHRRETVLVTGASGFVGTQVVAALRATLPAGTRIFGLDRGSGEAQLLDHLTVDITHRDEVVAAIRHVKPTRVVHLAAIAVPSIAQDAPRRAWDVNLFGTLNLAEAVTAHAPGAVFVNVSTSEVYGGSFNRIGVPLTEDTPVSPRNVYAATKASAEMAIEQLVPDGLRLITFRPFNHTGPGQSDAYVVPSFAYQIARIESGQQAPVLTVGNLDAQRDFMDARDVVKAYVAAVMHGDQLEPGCKINLASGVPRRIGDILRQLIQIGQVKVEVEVDPARLRANEYPVVMGDASKASRLLGWSTRIPFETTLRDILDHCRADVAAAASMATETEQH